VRVDLPDAGGAASSLRSLDRVVAVALARIEDIDALIKAAGGTARVCGVSSGAALALEAANYGLGIEKLALYEPPFIVDETRPPVPESYLTSLNEKLSTRRSGDAVKLFMKVVGVPGLFIALMALLPAWSKLKSVAHTLPYDAAIVGRNQRGKPLSPELWHSTTAPTLVIVGGKSPTWIKNAGRALAHVLSSAELHTLEGQTHMVRAKALVPALREFFNLPATHTGTQANHVQAA
jgi:pimeloyl-ACP methyl ester carboxylesterase